MNEPSTVDRNLLFGAIAMQIGLITADQFAEACAIWSMRKTDFLPAILCEKGWLFPDDQVHVEYLVERKLVKFGGDIKASFADYPAELRSVLASIGDNTIDYSAQQGRDTVTSGTSDTAVSSQGKAGQRYFLSTLHAAGGIGEIWLSRDADLCRDVAVKRLHSKKSVSEVAKMRFLREARITSQLDHPGVVPIYEICLDEETRQPYYSMRFLKGQTLTEAVKQYHEQRKSSGNDHQAFLTLLNAFCIVCNTVAYAHAKGIIHRDLKSENVILGDYGEVVVIDWGLAKEVGSYEVSQEDSPDQRDLASVNPCATLAGHILGTPAYMSPEQASGRLDLIGPKTDVYGLCAILYEILCGQPPFVGDHALDVLQKVQTTAPVPPSEIVANIPETLQQICLTGLAKSLDQRHPSADSLARAVQGWVSDLAKRRQAEEERERFFAISLDLLAIIEEDGRFRQVSPAWERFLGYARQEFSGRTFVDFINVDDQPAVLHHLQAAAEGQTGSTFEARVMLRNGSHRWISWNVTPIAKEQCLYVVGRDITDLKQSQRLFEGVLQSAPDAMVIIDPQGRMVMVNQQSERVFGYTQDEMIGHPVEMLIPERHRKQHPDKVAGFFATSSVRPMGIGTILQGLHKDGREFEAEIALSPIITETWKLVAVSVREVVRGRGDHRG